MFFIYIIIYKAIKQKIRLNTNTYHYAIDNIIAFNNLLCAFRECFVFPRLVRFI